MKLLVLNGPNLNMLGIREPNIYGKESYPQLVKLVEDTCRQLGVEVEVYQSNHEGDLVDKIQAAYGAKDAIVINPADYETIRLSKDSNGQYYGGGYFNGQYGNGTIMQDPPLWGLKTVVTEAVAAGTAIVGAFKLGGAVIRKGGLRAESTNSHSDDFTNDLITFRVRERIGLQVKYPKAFVKVALGKAAK